MCDSNKETIEMDVVAQHTALEALDGLLTEVLDLAKEDVSAEPKRSEGPSSNINAGLPKAGIQDSGAAGPSAGTSSAGPGEGRIGNRRKGLSGAAKRRIAWWIARGKTLQEARELCARPLDAFPEYREEQLKQNPLSGRAAKRTRADQDSSPRERPAKAARLKGHGATPTFAAVAGSVRLGIFNASGPLTGDQLDQLSKYIMKLMDASPEEEQGPCFLTMGKRSGGLVLTCADETTVRWVWQYVPDRVPWEGVKLVVYDEKQIPKPRIAVVFIPEQEIEDAVILKRFKRQNRGIDVSSWRVINKRSEAGGQTIALSIDEPSCELLASRDFKVFFGYGPVTFRVKPRREPGDEDREAEDGEGLRNEPPCQTETPTRPHPTATSTPLPGPSGAAKEAPPGVGSGEPGQAYPGSTGQPPAGAQPALSGRGTAGAAGGFRRYAPGFPGRPLFGPPPSTRGSARGNKTRPPRGLRGRGGARGANAGVRRPVQLPSLGQEHSSRKAARNPLYNQPK